MQCPSCGNEVPADAKFCKFCGHSLQGSPPPAPPTPRPRQRRWSLYGAILLVLLLGIVAVYLVVSNLVSVISGKPQILYAIQDEGTSDAISTLMIMNGDGDGHLEVAYDRDGLYLASAGYGEPQYLAPDGRWLAYFERTDEGWELVVASADGGSPLLVDNNAVRSTAVGTLGFSPDSRHFAYTTFNDRNDEIALHVLDATGAEVLMVPDVAFGSFFPDGNRLLVLETDDEGLFDGLAWLELNEGTPNRITNLTESSGWVRPLVLPDGNRISFYSEGELLMMDVAGGAAQRLHEFDSPASAVFVAPGGDYLTVYDQFVGESVGELRLINLADNRSIRIDTDSNLSPWGNRPGERAIDFSPDGKFVAYAADEPGNLSLYVTGVDGANRRRISDDNAWLTFAFSPNSRQIAFIEATDARRAGTLYIADMDGGNRLRLDVDVWSFRFIDGGRRLLYSKVQDIDRGDPESEIYRIDADGDNQELLLGVQDGIISFVEVLR